MIAACAARGPQLLGSGRPFLATPCCTLFACIPRRRRPARAPPDQVAVRRFDRTDCPRHAVSAAVTVWSEAGIRSDAAPHVHHQEGKVVPRRIRIFGKLQTMENSARVIVPLAKTPLCALEPLQLPPKLGALRFDILNRRIDLRHRPITKPVQFFRPRGRGPPDAQGPRRSFVPFQNASAMAPINSPGAARARRGFRATD